MRRRARRSGVSIPELLPLFVFPLQHAGLATMVTGSVASAIYGEPRLTRDVDVVLALKPREAGRLIGAFPAAEFYVPPRETLIEEASRPRHGHFNIHHLDSGLRADVYLLGDDPLNEWAMELRRAVTVSGETVWLAPPEYVILMKLTYYRDAGSPKHLRDIAWMLQVSEALIDRPLLERKVRELGLDGQWEAALATPLDA